MSALRKTVSLTSHLAVVGIVHAVLNLHRLVLDCALDLRPDDARLPRGSHERRGLVRVENRDGVSRLPRDQDPTRTMQRAQAILSRCRAEAATKSSGLAGD